MQRHLQRCKDLMIAEVVGDRKIPEGVPRCVLTSVENFPSWHKERVGRISGKVLDLLDFPVGSASRAAPFNPQALGSNPSPVIL
jgi:hypothetical protein